MVGSRFRWRRLGEERLSLGRQRDLQEAKEAVCVQKWTQLCGEQEAKPLPVHQRRLLMVRMVQILYHRIPNCHVKQFYQHVWDHVLAPTTKTAWRINAPCEAITFALFHSDYGYYRHVNTSECVRQHSAANKTLELCLNGEEDELLTAG